MRAEAVVLFQFVEHNQVLKQRMMLLGATGIEVRGIVQSRRLKMSALPGNPRPRFGLFRFVAMRSRHGRLPTGVTGSALSNRFMAKVNFTRKAGSERRWTRTCKQTKATCSPLKWLPSTLPVGTTLPNAQQKTPSAIWSVDQTTTKES